MDLREEIYNHMIECMLNRITFNNEQKMYILEYMERYANAVKSQKHNKQFKFTFKDIDGEELLIVNENTLNKAFKLAFRMFEKPKDRELKLISKELNER